MSSTESTTERSLRPGDPIVAKFPCFYGWVMLPIAIVGQISTSPAQTYGISEFNASFTRDLALSNTELTAAYMFGTLLASLPMWFIGRLMDRHGIRTIMAVVVFLFGGACLGMSQVSGLVTIFLAFMMLRMLGQGALSLLSSNTLSMWFHDRLGTVAGIMSAGTALAIAVIPAINRFLIVEFGWRWAYAILGFAVWLGMLPLLAIFYRNRPEDVGQVPDGIEKSSTTQTEDHENVQVQFTLNQATHTFSYWILLTISATWALVATAVIFNKIDLFKDCGLSENEVSLFFPFFGISLAIAQIGGGLFADRFRAKTLLFYSMAIMTVALIYLTTIQTSQAVYLFAVMFGISQGLFTVVGHSVWVRYFGRDHLGKIRGTVWTGCVAGSSAGPLIMGISKDYLSSYEPSIWLFVGFYTVLTIATLFADAPKKDSSDDSLRRPPSDEF